MSDRVGTCPAYPFPTGPQLDGPQPQPSFQAPTPAPASCHGDSFESCGLDEEAAAFVTDDGLAKTKLLGLVARSDGRQGELSASLGDAQIGHDRGTNVRGSLGSATLTGGTHNKDGSEGLNFGAELNAASFEGTISDGANSLTFGASAGLGFGFSIGGRDADGNGEFEGCLRLSALGLTGGLCLEEIF